jgi:hypothetical protein
MLKQCLENLNDHCCLHIFIVYLKIHGWLTANWKFVISCSSMADQIWCFDIISNEVTYDNVEYEKIIFNVMTLCCGNRIYET